MNRFQRFVLVAATAILPLAGCVAYDDGPARNHNGPRIDNRADRDSPEDRREQPEDRREGRRWNDHEQRTER